MEPKELSLWSADKDAQFGSGYGLVPDLVISSILWTLLQIALFQWPDLASYKMKRFSYLDMRNRMVSFIHGILILIMSLHFMITAEY